MKYSVFCVLMLTVILWGYIANAATTLGYIYDNNGNLVTGEGKYYEYNDANQLVRVRHGNATGPVLAEYVYDYNGQRIKKIENGVTTYYIGKNYETKIADFGKTKTNTSYYFANGERVAKKDSTGQLYYYYSDHLGGTNAVTDATGNLTERITYYPFGEIREGGAEKYTYTGKEKDKQTDWYYFEARYYNPQLKHFTQADTVIPNLYNPQNLNRFSYVNNNPIKFIDPSGHKEQSFQIASSEWLSEFKRASKEDKTKYELMKKQYYNWEATGGPQIDAEKAYWDEYVKRTNWLHDSAFVVKHSADIGVTVLASMTGPGGKAIKGGYDSINMFVENVDLVPKLLNGNVSGKEALSRSINLGIKLVGNKLSDSIGSYEVISSFQKGIGQAIVEKSIIAPTSWAVDKLFSD